MTNYQVRPRFKNERGVSYILAIALIFSVLAIATLGLGIGFTMMSKSRLQNIANLVALSALDTAVSKRILNPVLTPPPPEVLNRIKIIADQILANNKIPGASWGRFLNDSAGTIRLGVWHEIDPDGLNSLDPCLGNYPCFEDLPEYSPAVTAIKVELQGNNTTNQIIAPFLRLFGSDAKPISASATAVIAGQCSVVLMDVSRSTTYDTHKPKNVATSPNPKSAQFIYDKNAKTAPNNSSNSFQQLDISRPTTAPVNWAEHFQSDYELITARTTNNNSDQLLVDKFNEAADNPDAYRGPQPQTDLFFGTNVALRAIREFAKGSLWRGIGFAGLSTETSVAALPAPSGGFAPGPEPLIQLTNLFNRQTFGTSGGQATPYVGANIFSFGWYAPPFPINPITGAVDENPDQEKTNLIEAFELAINSFSQVAPNGRSCPASYAKTIYLATDGVMNCDKSATAPPYTCANTFLKFRAATTQLLDTLVPELQRKNIKVVTLISGKSVQPHFKNIKAPQGYVTSTGSDYLEPEEAIALGYGAFKEPNPNFKLIKEEASVPASACQTWNGGSPCNTENSKNAYAMKHLGQEIIGTEDTIFRLPVSVMAQLSIDTGGDFCPILPVDPDPNAYILNPAGQLRYNDAKRIEGEPQIFATERLYAGDQARKCFRRSWQNKVVLVEQEN
jgi:hypothetical protein